MQFVCTDGTGQPSSQVSGFIEERSCDSFVDTCQNERKLRFDFKKSVPLVISGVNYSAAYKDGAESSETKHLQEQSL